MPDEDDILQFSIPQAQRDAIPAADFAGPGSTYPIDTVAHLHAACTLYGRAANPAAVKAKIVAIARRKGWLKELPEAWDVPDGDGDSDDKGMSEPQAYAGARHSKSDSAIVQTMHDHSVALGAQCSYAAVPPEQVAAMSNRDLSEHPDDSFVRACEMAEDASHHSLISDLPQWFNDAAAPPEWIPYLPTPHTFKHPRYGEVVMSKERNANFVQQFKAGVYQNPLPLDGEHQTKLSGALAWIGDLRQNDDGSVDAKVSWTPRGSALYSTGAFKYISPEFYDEWTDPATNIAHKDVAIGGALTTRPFFKASHLRPLAASEDNVQTPQAGEGGSGMTATVLAEVSAEQFSELQGKHTELEQQYAEVVRERDELKASRESDNERITRLEKEARTKRFSEIVAGWPGDPAANVARLEKVADRFGEESEDFKDEVTERRAFAEQTKLAAKAGNLYKEVGSPARSAGSDAGARIDAMAKERQTASHGAKSYQQAYAEVLEENPALYEEATA